MGASDPLDRCECPEMENFCWDGEKSGEPATTTIWKWHAPHFYGATWECTGATHTDEEAWRLRKQLNRGDCGVKSSLRREPNLPADLLRARFANVTTPFCLIASTFRFSLASNPQKTVVRWSVCEQLPCPSLSSHLPVVPAGADNPAAATKVHKVFDILRGNDKIGTDTIDIEHENDTITVKVKTDVSVKVMFIEAYRYEHSCNETWKNGQLVAFQSRNQRQWHETCHRRHGGAGQAEHGRRRQA